MSKPGLLCATVDSARLKHTGTTLRSFSKRINKYNRRDYLLAVKSQRRKLKYAQQMYRGPRDPTTPVLRADLGRTNRAPLVHIVVESPSKLEGQTAESLVPSGAASVELVFVVLVPISHPKIDLFVHILSAIWYSMAAVSLDRS